MSNGAEEMRRYTLREWISGIAEHSKNLERLVILIHFLFLDLTLSFRKCWIIIIKTCKFENKKKSFSERRSKSVTSFNEEITEGGMDLNEDEIQDDEPLFKLEQNLGTAEGIF